MEDVSTPDDSAAGPCDPPAPGEEKVKEEPPPNQDDPPLNNHGVSSRTDPPLKDHGVSSRTDPPLKDHGVSSRTDPPLNNHGVSSRTDPPLKDLGVSSRTDPPLNNHGVSSRTDPPLKDHGVSSRTDPPLNNHGVSSRTDPPLKDHGVSSRTDPPLKDHGVSSRTDPPLKDHGISSRTDPPLKVLSGTQQGAVFSGKILSFGCSVCKDSSTFSPNDLLKHFTAAHQGALPTYPCDLCHFVTHEFPALQQHRIGHRNTLVTCELCGDDVQYSLLLLTRHYVVSHSTNGQFRCDWCHFCTADAGTFVQHIHHHNESHWRCHKCRHVSLGEDEHRAHLKGHSGVFPYTCAFCGYGAARSDYLKKHKATVHKDLMGRRVGWRPGEEPPLKAGETRNNGLNGRPVKPEPNPEENHFLDGFVAKKGGRHFPEQPAPVVLQDGENSSGSDAEGGHPNGLTVLMVKNKISLPPNCTTKVMGFKMVDGKKHLVLKVIPSAKPDPSGPDAGVDKEPLENGQHADASGTGQDNVVAVKVKVEEEETSVCSFDSALRSGDAADAGRPTERPPGRPGTDASLTDTKDYHHLNNNGTDRVKGDSNSADETFDSDKTRAPPTGGGAKAASLAASLAPPSHQETLLPKSSLENCRASEESSPSDDDGKNPPANQILLTGLDSPPSQLSGKASAAAANQEVFTFHNYSKETFSTALSNLDSTDDRDDRDSAWESSQLNLTLAESPESSPRSEPDGDDEPPTEENPDSVLQEFNIIKVEEENIPVSTKPPEPKRSSSSVGKFVVEHSEEIIHQQLSKERDAQPTTVRLLQPPENRLAAPTTPTTGFKLITNSSNPQINVTRLNSGVERSRKAKLLGIPAARLRAAENGTARVSGVAPNHYLINSHGFKSPVLLSKALAGAARDRTAKAQPTCYLVQRSLPFVQAPPGTSGLKLAGTAMKPVLAMPVGSADKPGALPAGRQAFLLRYVSAPKSVLNKAEGKTAAANGDGAAGAGKVIFKIVTPTGAGLLKAGPNAAGAAPLFLATRPQCFLLANKPATAGVKAVVGIENERKDAVPSRVNGAEPPPPGEAERLLAVRPPSQRKRRRNALLDDLPPAVAAAHKARRLQNKGPAEVEPEPWRPVPKDTERTLRLAPVRPGQPVRCPRRHQPVVVLNHPDAGGPEAAAIMRVVTRYRGAVAKVALCPRTVQALAGPAGGGGPAGGDGAEPDPPDHLDHPDPRTSRAPRSSVRERFLLRLKLRKKSRKKYEVVETPPGRRPGSGSAGFGCWFCGRIFSNQEDWIGHGQRHLMEATRDWNQLC
ncbi:zinc finger protein 518A-like [Cololabis saira]|uniref:zinc finger protein 518A-like n=1 Tax=Cololabis saira TaxID=129043 RepID=UPI002AD323CE|nr:zinc finger protein 518A-like [Cololabis saira]XP_061565270.1 zinc finger protein 518A-like [Cololabis saira]